MVTNAPNHGMLAIFLMRSHHVHEFDNPYRKSGFAESPHYHGHRERLRERFRDGGPDALSDYELLEMVSVSRTAAARCETARQGADRKVRLVR